MNSSLEQAWQLAKQRYADSDVNAEQALALLDTLPVSMHCWQGDDVAGFENPTGTLTGGFRPPVIIPVKPPMLSNCAPIWSRRLA
ncbi:L-rhamnose isomerase [Sodalis praecaptivus]